MSWTFGRIGVPTPSVFTDDFERADGPLDDNGWTPDGITTVGSSDNGDASRYLQIVSGRATLGVTGAGYALRRVPGLRKVTISFRYSAGTSSASTAIGIACSDRPISEGLFSVALHSVHIQVSPLARLVNYYDATISAAVDTDTFALAATTDYTFSVEMHDDGSITVVDPDGGSETLPAGAGRALWGDSIYIECLVSDLAHKLPSINSVTLEGDTTIHLDFHDPAQWDGEELRLSADLPAPTPSDAVALRDAFNGYDLNPDEPEVAITSTEDPSIDGLYRVNSVTVDDSQATFIEGGLGSQVTVEAIKVSGSSAPLVEVTRRGADRVNVHAVTDGVPLTFLPGSAKVPRWESVPDGSGFVGTEDGSVVGYAGPGYSNPGTYHVIPDSFYEGACRIEVSSDGAEWRTVVGRQVANLPNAVRLTNGRMRVTLYQSGGATVLATEAWDATGLRWEPCDFNVVDTGTPTSIATYTHPFIKGPTGIASGADGNLWFTGTNNNRIWKVTPSGALTTFTNASIDGPFGIASGPDGLLWFTSKGNDKIGKVTAAGSFTFYTDANIDFPLGICSGPDGLLWFTNYDNGRIGKITTSGTVTTYTDADISGPRSICSGPDGLLWFTSQNSNRIGKITTSGVVTTYTTGVGTTPHSICSGPDGLLWFTRPNAAAICKITTTGTVTTYTSGVPSLPSAICSDGTDLWFTYEDGIGKITTSGVVTTYTKSTIDDPLGIVKGPDGNLWFTSSAANRVGVLNPGSGVGAIEFGGTLTIQRNSPEVVSIKVGAADGDETLDLVLRRGYNLAEGYVQGTSAAYGVYRTASETGVAVTGGITANTANTYGNKYTLLSPRTITKDVTGVSGIYLSSAATSFPFSVSPVNASTLSGEATMNQAYFAAVEHQQKISAR